MSERANFQKNYLMRYAIMAAICLGAGFWFAYDGFVGYPKLLPAAEAYDELSDIDSDAERITRWEALAKQNGWPISTPKKKAQDIKSDITGQYFWMTLCFFGGIPALLFYLRSRGTWVESTDDGLKTSWGQQLKFSDVTQLNKKRWAKKGIARAVYTTEGVTKTFVFDDFKYDREPLGRILRSLEDVLEREKITGGPTEAETDAEKAESASEQASEPEE